MADTPEVRDAELAARGPEAVRELLKSTGPGTGATVKGTTVPRSHTEQWLTGKDAE